MLAARNQAFARFSRFATRLTRFLSTEAPLKPHKFERPPPQSPYGIFSGIQPTGIPHLGNYLGALRQWKQLQDDETYANGKRYFSIVDLHALTVYQDPATLARSVHETLAALLAIGLTPAKSNVFVQSEISAHAELMWILSTIASTGYLSRMTQWKSKLDLPEDSSLDDKAARASLKLGLFSYPVLQAADVLLYETAIVPIGEDQAQHIEFARSLAASFNALYPAKPFRLPEALISPAKRVMSLKTPTVKMSKSDPNPASRILITDSPDDIHYKIRMALTDSEPGITFDHARRPGVSNLLEILRHASHSERSCEDHAKDLHGVSMKAFKEHVADEVIKCLDGIRPRFQYLTQTRSGHAELADAREAGRNGASSTAEQTMVQIKRAVGLGPFVPATDEKLTEVL